MSYIYPIIVSKHLVDPTGAAPTTKYRRVRYRDVKIPLPMQQAITYRQGYGAYLSSPPLYFCIYGSPVSADLLSERPFIKIMDKSCSLNMGALAPFDAPCLEVEKLLSRGPEFIAFYVGWCVCGDLTGKTAVPGH